MVVGGAIGKLENLSFYRIMMMKGVVILMDKNSLVNIDLQPIADVTNNLINKLAEGIGWIATPKGKKAQQIEAQNYLIEQIKRDEKMPPLAKAASISNAKKLIREYTNQNDIVNDAMIQLLDKANPDGVDNEWLSTFMDYCKNVEAEDVKAIWSKILVEECNKNGSIPKKLLMILATISNENALAFSKLCFCAINIPMRKDNDFYEVVVFFDKLWNEYEEQGINYGKLLELESMGLINMDDVQGYYINSENILQCEEGLKLNYYENAIDLDIVGNELSIGNIVFTDAGRALFSAINIAPKMEVLKVIKKGLKRHNKIKS